MTTPPTLEKLRSSIDEIDEDIHDLLLRRTDLVTQIGELKRTNNKGVLSLRPSREAAMIRRLIERHTGPFPVATLVQIWRELLAGQVLVQSRCRIAMFEPQKGPTNQNIVRDHFGGSARISELTSSDQVVKAISQDEAEIGVVPVPSLTGGDHWWVDVANESKRQIHVVAKLPFLRQQDGSAGTGEALLIAKILPEPSGDDITLLALTLSENSKTDRLLNLMNSKSIEARLLAMSSTTEYDSKGLYLVEIDTFIAGIDQIRSDLIDSKDSLIEKIVVVGAYAKQFSLLD